MLANLGRAGKQFQTMQVQLESLMAKTEELKVDLTEREVSSVASSEPENRPRAESDRSMYAWMSFEERFQEILSKFHQRYLREESLQLRLRESLQSVAAILDNRPVVQQEL